MAQSRSTDTTVVLYKAYRCLVLRRLEEPQGPEEARGRGSSRTRPTHAGAVREGRADSPNPGWACPQIRIFAVPGPVLVAREGLRGLDGAGSGGVGTFGTVGGTFGTCCVVKTEQKCKNKNVWFYNKMTSARLAARLGANHATNHATQNY